MDVPYVLKEFLFNEVQFFYISEIEHGRSALTHYSDSERNEAKQESGIPKKPKLVGKIVSLDYFIIKLTVFEIREAIRMGHLDISSFSFWGSPLSK